MIHRLYQQVHRKPYCTQSYQITIYARGRFGSKFPSATFRILLHHHNFKNNNSSSAALIVSRRHCTTTATSSHSFKRTNQAITMAGTKRMSAEEKRKVILGIYHSTKAVYTEKEILALATKAGVNAGTYVGILS